MNNREMQERKQRSDRRWTLIIIAAFISFTPAGVALLIAKLLDLLPNIGGSIHISEPNVQEATARYRPEVWQRTDAARTVPHSAGNLQTNHAGQPTKTAQTAARLAEEEKAAQKAAQQVKSAQTAEESPERKGMPEHGTAFTVFGIISTILGGGFGLTKLIELLETFSAAKLVAAAGWLSIMAAGIVFTVYGNIRKNKKRRFEAYLKLIGDKDYISIHELADMLGMDYRKVLKDLQEMIRRGILDPAWIDMKTYRLMLSEYTGQVVEEKKEEYLPRSERILRQIRADNDLIADEEVSRKIDRIEDLTRKIFAIVDKYPEKESQLYSFLNYYLPTTLKTLESYARLEAQGIETVSIREAKQKINLALDELADGYERQLDKLFEGDVVDISADIEVMRQMLQKDGLTEDEIMKAGK